MNLKTTFGFALRLDRYWALLILLSGCALTTDQVTLNYKSPGVAAKIDGAGEVKVFVDMFDVRGMKDRVGVKKNAYGMEMAPIISETSVPLLVTTAIESELVLRGFSIGEGAVRLFVELQKFYNDFKSGFWSGTAAAELLMNAQVKAPSGEILYSKLIVGNGNLPGIQLASGENAKIALEDALTDSMGKLFADRALFDMIFKASKSQPGAVSLESIAIK